MKMPEEINRLEANREKAACLDLWEIEKKSTYNYPAP
jgi:hypothetical protein